MFLYQRQGNLRRPIERSYPSDRDMKVGFWDEEKRYWTEEFENWCQIRELKKSISSWRRRWKLCALQGGLWPPLELQGRERIRVARRWGREMVWFRRIRGLRAGSFHISILRSGFRHRPKPRPFGFLLPFLSQVISILFFVGQRGNYFILNNHTLDIG